MAVRFFDVPAIAVHALGDVGQAVELDELVLDILVGDVNGIGGGYIVGDDVVGHGQPGMTGRCMCDERVGP